jgi:hypothetical protein
MAEALSLTKGLLIMFNKEIKVNLILSMISESSMSEIISAKVLAAILSSSSDVSGLKGLALQALVCVLEPKVDPDCCRVRIAVVRAAGFIVN